MGPERGLYEYPSEEDIDIIEDVDSRVRSFDITPLFEDSLVGVEDYEGFVGGEVIDFEDSRLERAYTLNFPEGYPEAEFCAARGAYSEEDFENIGKALAQDPIDPTYINRVKSVIEQFKAAIDEVHELIKRADRVRLEYKQFELATSESAVRHAYASMIMEKTKGRYSENDSYIAYLEEMTDRLAGGIGEMRQIEQELSTPLKSVQDKKRILEALKARAEFTLGGSHGTYVQWPEILPEEREALPSPDTDDSGDWKQKLARQQDILASRNESNLGK